MDQSNWVEAHKAGSHIKADNMGMVLGGEASAQEGLAATGAAIWQPGGCREAELQLVELSGPSPQYRTSMDQFAKDVQDWKS